MAQDKERQIRLQFLDEAQEYLDSIESILLGLGDRGLSSTQIDGLLRAAHSIKGGAAMMDFTILSQLAHRIEDFFKVLKTGRDTVDGALEQQLLRGVDRLGQVTQRYRQGNPVDEDWLNTEIEPIFGYLQERLGDPLPEDNAQLLSQDEGQDMRVLMFETEVESCLARLESIQGKLDQPLILEEVLIASQELSCLGEMLELERFVSLCRSIEQRLREDESGQRIMDSLAILRRAQALVLIGQWDLIPTELELAELELAELDVVELDLEEDRCAAIEASTISQSLNTTASQTTTIEMASIESRERDSVDLTILDLDAAELISAALVGSDLLSSDLLSSNLSASDGLGNPSPDEPTDSDITAGIWLTDEPSLAPINHPSAETAPTIDDAISWGLELGQIDRPNGEMADFAAADFAAADFGTADFAGIEATDVEVATSDLPLLTKPLIAEPILELDSADFATADFTSIDLTLLAAPIAPAPSQKPIAPETSPPASNQTETTATKSPTETSIRVPVKQLEQLSELFGELTTERNGLKGQLRQVRGLLTLMAQRVQRLEQANAKLRVTYDNVAIHKPADATTAASPAESNLANPPNRWRSLPERESASTSGFDALEMDQYSDLHLISQEIIESVVQLQEVRDDMEIALTETEGTSREMSRTSERMQIGLTQVRMRPIDDIVGRFPRVLRELSLTHNKPVNLKLRGKETLVERSVLDALNGPLMHLLRNCFDHGIESSADRLAKGKLAQGTIELSASYRGDNTVIVLKDDGGGINLDKIRTKARAMGFTETELEQASRSELLNLIFEPGFSTADKVTALSGRGVGMDVVRTNLTEVGGQITIETEADQGTTFTLSVPLSLAVRRVLLVENQGFWMAFPSSIVEEFQLLHPEQINAEGNQIDWQGEWIPLVKLDQHLQFARPQRQIIQEQQPPIDRPLVLIVDYQDQPYAIQVDRYWGEQEFTSRGVAGRRGLPSGFSSCVVLGDGRIVPLVDVDALLSQALRQAQSQALSQHPPMVQPKPALVDHAPIDQTTIMVIDDSINVRRFLALTLEKAGYRVEQAKDGQDAIDKLKASSLVNAIICDVEMPRLDGFGFLAQVKALPQHRHIPVTMLTSRSGNKHRQIAFRLGATAYFSKPFKQQELLETLAQLTARPAVPAEAIGIAAL